MLNFRPYYLTLLSRIFHPTVTVPLFSHSFTHTCTSTLYHSILLTHSCTQLSLLSTLSPTFSSSYPFLTPLPNLTPFHHLSLFFLIFNYTLFPLLLHSLTSPSYPILSTYLFASKPSLSTCLPQLSPNDVLVSHPTLFTHLFLPLLSLNPLFTQFSNAYQGHSLIPLSNPTLLPLIPLSHYPLTPV